MTNHTARIGGALVGGYLLGRTRKARMALGLGMFLAGRKLSLNPQQLGRMAANSPALSGLSDQARRELVDATKSAATSALTKRADSFADTLHQRTLDLGGTPGEADADAEEPGDTATGEGDSAKQTAPRERAPAERTSSGKTGSGKTGSGRSGSGKTSRNASGKRPASGTSSAKTATKTATKTAAKSTTKSAKAASGGRRSNARGGDDG